MTTPNLNVGTIGNTTSSYVGQQQVSRSQLEFHSYQSVGNSNASSLEDDYQALAILMARFLDWAKKHVWDKATNKTSSTKVSTLFGPENEGVRSILDPNKGPNLTPFTMSGDLEQQFIGIQRLETAQKIGDTLRAVIVANNTRKEKDIAVAQRKLLELAIDSLMGEYKAVIPSEHSPVFKFLQEKGFDFTFKRAEGEIDSAITDMRLRGVRPVLKDAAIKAGLRIYQQQKDVEHFVFPKRSG